MTGADLAAAAQSLVGTRFRLHGRDPTGVDCIGLLEVALARAGRAVHLPQGYPLRLSRIGQWLPEPAALGFTACEGVPQPGDVILLRPAPGQFHLAIALGGEDRDSAAVIEAIRSSRPK